MLLVLAACSPSAHEAANQATPLVEHAVQTHDGPVSATPFSMASSTGSAELAFLFVPADGFAYLDEHGHPIGVTVELLRDFAAFVAREHGLLLDVRWIQQPSWSTFYAQVRASHGAVFGIGNVTITDARDAELDFSPAYMSNVAVLVTHERTPTLSAMEAIGTEFAAHTALVFPGTLHEQRLARIAGQGGNMELRPVSSNDEIIDLLAGDGDYFAYVDAYNFWRARQQGRALRRHPVGDDDSEAFGVIMPDGSDWTTVMQAFFAADGGYTQSARFRSLLQEHLGEELANVILAAKDSPD
jgi:hypothetical protein